MSPQNRRGGGFEDICLEEKETRTDVRRTPPVSIPVLGTGSEIVNGNVTREEAGSPLPWALAVGS